MQVIKIAPQSSEAAKWDAVDGRRGECVATSQVPARAGIAVSAAQLLPSFAASILRGEKIMR
jgi:hypothetical protein